MTIHQWEGQSMLLILAPLLATMITGYAILIQRRRLQFGTSPLLGSFAGLLYIGTGLMITMQTIIAAEGATATSLLPVTLIFAVAPIALGAVIIKKSFKATAWTLRERIISVVLGVLGLAFWAGLIFGPFIIMLMAVTPPYTSKKRARAA